MSVDFEMTYEGLPVGAARLFRLLAVHRGHDFALGAAAALAGQGGGVVRQLLDVLAGEGLLVRKAPDRYRFAEGARDVAFGRDGEEGERESALRRLLDWYLHTADAAQAWIDPSEERVRLAPPADGVVPQAFRDYDAAVDWAEYECRNVPPLIVGVGGDGEFDECVGKLAAVWFAAQPPSASPYDWLPVGRAGLAAASRTGDRAAEALLSLDLGMAHAWACSLAEARDCYETALRLYRELDDQAGQAQALNLLGLACLRTRQLTDAIRHFGHAVAVFRELGDAHWQAVARSNLATAYFNAGHLDEAGAAARQALDVHRSRGNRRGEGNLLRLLSRLQREQGRVDDALETAEAAVGLALDLRDHALEGYWLLALGDAQRAAAGRLGEALTSYHRSATLHRRLGSRSREAMGWHGAGETYRLLQRPEEARDFLRLAAAAHRELGDAWHEALSRDALAEALGDMGAPAEARDERAEALRLLAGFDDPRAVGVRERVARRRESGGG